MDRRVRSRVHARSRAPDQLVPAEFAAQGAIVAITASNALQLTVGFF